MNINDLKYFKLIGETISEIKKASSVDETIRVSLKNFIDSGLIDYAVVWYANDSEQKVLCPYFWICPIELTSQTYLTGEGSVGRVFQNQKTECIYDFVKNPDTAIQEMFAGISISSHICIPFSISDKPMGCIELIKITDHGFVNEDEVSICEIFAIMIQTMIMEQYPQFKQNEKSVLLSVRNIHKYYNSGDTLNHVIKGFNLDVFKGEIVCFLGVSGCGKSTMLNILGGLLDFEEGSLVFEGKEMRGAKKDELSEYRRENIGFVYQSYNLMPNLNAKHNIELIGELVKNPMDAMELLAMVGLKDKAKSYPAKLSGGEQQRVAIARAMVKRPKLILADEPTAALDYNTSIEVLEAFLKAKKSGATIVIVTHNEEISKMADRVIRFRDGKMYETTINVKPKKPAELVW